MVQPPTRTVEQSVPDRAADRAPAWTDERRQALSDLIDAWIAVGPEEAQEQRETLEYLMEALNEDAPSYRKRFP